MKDKVNIRGYTEISQLKEFFEAKGHHNIVFREEDISDLQPHLLKAVGELRDKTDSRSVNGHLVIPVKQLCDGRFKLTELSGLQEVVACYREIRRGKAYPLISKLCTCVTPDEQSLPYLGENTPVASAEPTCRACDGTGKVEVLTEMSPEEIELALER